MDSQSHIETVVIGGGQAGLSVGYQLSKRGRSFVILDASSRVGDAWRSRWDSLRLFTPAKFNGLPGMRFPARRRSFVGKDQMADFLEDYARHFQIPIRSGQRVQRLSRRGDRYQVETNDHTYVADNVVVAMSNYQIARIPELAAALSSEIVQLHSSQYKSAQQLQAGSVLVVGAGNSGADIAMDLTGEREVFLSGNDVGQIPFRIETSFALSFGIPMVRFLGHHILSVGTPVGRKARPKLSRIASPRVRVKMKDLLDAGIKIVPRVARVENGAPALEDGSPMSVRNVVWCTGYTHGFSWIDLPIFDDDQQPRHDRGVVADHPGLYFVGLHFLRAATSDTVTGVQRDAKSVVKHLHARMSSRERSVGARVPKVLNA